MPIYEYICQDCQFKDDLLLKLSESGPKSCPNCGKKNFQKSVSAPAFKLNGTGWYVTDFKDSKKDKAKTADKKETSKSENKTNA